MTDPQPLPPGVSIGRGRLQFWSERYGGRPYVDCMLASACMVLSWRGYKLPLDFTKQLRAATGKPAGLGFADVQKALDEILPSAGDMYEGISEADLYTQLRREGFPGRRSAMFQIAVKCDKLPDNLRRLVGHGYTGWHSVVLGWKNEKYVTGQVDPVTGLYLDPMGRVVPPRGAPITWKPYAGQDDIDFGPVLAAAAKTNAGLVKVIYGFKNTAA